MSERNLASVIGAAAANDAGSETRMRAARRLAPLHEVVVTGIGVVLPNCSSREQLWQQLHQGQSQLCLDQDGASSYAVGRVKSFDSAGILADVPRAYYANCSREQLFYVCSVVQAYRDAGFTAGQMASDRVGLFDGTSRGNFAFWYELLSNRNRVANLSVRHLKQGMPGQAVGLAAAILHIKGPTYTFNGTCASGAIAIGNAYRELQAGRIDVAFGTGHDAALVPAMFEMYRDAGLMNTDAEEAASSLRAYVGHSKNVFGEGAISLVLETREHADARGASILAQLAGYRHGNGGEHPTEVDFSGCRPADLIENALQEAELPADGVDVVVGHGNGVTASDLSELNYMRRVFGSRTRDVPLISTKPIYGHTLGASSALNVAAVALMLDAGYVIPTINIDEARVAEGFNHQANRGVSRALRSGVAVSFGMGGQNTAIALKKV
ncbi:MAG TPA: beta-ketoacyl synthase N-terminal-like domain-containing protein [Polyangiaceae bacterium]|nr:beta-ketoacyl synthase N-terminal-like domain-containing protein [Polyangiaceae bacterium]